MRGRRTATLLMAVAAVAVPVIGGVAPAASSATPKQHTICVALVVDFADLGGGVHSSCATIRPGQTGYDVLSAGGHTFTICSNGVLGTIDGQPANACQIKDDTHYWTYWHRAPRSGSWTYSSEGGGTYQPANTATEGWRWRGGGSLTPPSNVPYSKICPTSPSPTPPPRTTSPPRRTPSPSTVRTTAAPVAPTPSGAHPAATSNRPTATPTPTPPAPDPAATTSPPAVVNLSDHSQGKSSRPPIGLLAGAAAIVGLGGAAGWRARRHRGRE
jgi:hypothetical protein